MTTYRLSILSFEDRSYSRLIERGTRSALARTAAGININLNHDEYYTEIEEEDDDDE